MTNQTITPSYFDLMDLIRRIVNERGGKTLLGNIEFWLEGKDLVYFPRTEEWDGKALQADLESWHREVIANAA